MLTSTHRLRDAASFRTAVRQGRRAGSHTLVVHLFAPEPGTVSPAGAAAPGAVRVGFVVSKAVGNAATRNRVKRRLRHLAREHVSSLPGSAVLVVRALPDAAHASYAELGADLERCLRRVQPS